MANDAGALMAADVRAAQTLLDALYADLPASLTEGQRLQFQSLELTWRGVIAQHLADVRTAGYIEGVQTGRRQAGGLIREALRDEGL